ncbi:zinc finger, BED-type containing protein [Tanacetum coccineum]
MEAGNEDELVVDVDEHVIDVDEPAIVADEPVIDVDEDNEQNEEARRRKSFVWKHFTYVKGAMKHQCPYCKTWLASGTRKHGTSAMGNHLKFSCTTSPVYEKVTDRKKQSTLNFKPSSLGQSGSSLGLEEHITSVDKIRNAVRYLRSSPGRLTSFEESVEFEKIDCGRKPCLDVDTRWNSTFLMLETALKFQSAFDRLQVIDPNYRSYFRNEVEDDGEDSTRSRKRKKNDRVLGAPEEDDWEYARSIMEYLRIFFSVTKKISGSKYVTANLFFGELVTMHATISQMCEHADEKKKKMALSMKDKYDKYWDNLDNMNFLLHVALVLDPRNKLYYLKYCLGLIYGEPEESEEEMFESDDEDLSKRGQVVKRVKSTLTELYKHYKMKPDKEKDQNTPVASSSTPYTCVASRLKVDIESGFGKYKEKLEGIKNTEVDIYLRDGD